MIIWLDNHLSPALARWMTERFGVTSTPVRDLGLARASDLDIFDAARGRAQAIITKDRDFAELAARFGPPPAIILLNFGNTSTGRLIEVLSPVPQGALDFVVGGEALIEIGG